MTRNLVVLGATGSIGTQALEVVDAYNQTDEGKANPVAITGLAANASVALLEKQIRKFRPRYAALYDEEKARDLKARVADLDVQVFSGMGGLLELASAKEADTVLTSLVGMIGIRPTIAAIEAGKDVALANKETLVAAGEIIMPLVARRGVKLLPVDSEHSAIFQCLNGEPRNKIEEILLTASGGPFRGKTRAELKNATKADALRHPNWSMGAKITIDSATMVNKGLEVIEAMRLFAVSPDQIRVVVQPDSIVHSMVRFVDGSVIAQMGLPDMKLPIRYALFYPDRVYADEKRLDFFELQSISFAQPDTETFLGLPLAYEAAKTGGSMPAVYNAANEAAVGLFLQDRIRFLDIYDIIAEACAKHRAIAGPKLDDIFAAEEETRARIAQDWK